MKFSYLRCVEKDVEHWMVDESNDDDEMHKNGKKPIISSYILLKTQNIFLFHSLTEHHQLCSIDELKKQ